jgi:hypothetical protein
MKKIPYADCGMILQRFEQSEEASALLDQSMPPSKAVEALYQAELVLDVINFLAHAFPPREGICWALSVLAGCPPQTQDAATARQVARDWVNEPSEQTRRRCGTLADSLGTDGPDGWLCHAVFWNGSGSIVTPDLPVVLPQPFLHAKAVFGTIGLLVPIEDDERAVFADRVYSTGMVVADGGWPCLTPQGGN